MVVEATQKERKNKKETRPINLDKDFRDCHWKQGEKFRGGGGGVDSAYESGGHARCLA